MKSRQNKKVTRKSARTRKVPTKRAMAAPAPEVPTFSEKSKEELRADLATSAVASSAYVTASFSRLSFGEVPYLEVVKNVADLALSVRKGNLNSVEDTLVAQANALNSIFASMATRAHMNSGEYLEATETYMKLALRAQSQCRATLETLAAIKNPPVVFAKQANISHGHQQVNNGAATAPAHAKQIENKPNELLEHDHGEWLDTGTPGPTGRSDKAMATMEVVHGATNRRRQSQRQP